MRAQRLFRRLVDIRMETMGKVSLRILFPLSRQLHHNLNGPNSGTHIKALFESNSCHLRRPNALIETREVS